MRTSPWRIAPGAAKKSFNSGGRGLCKMVGIFQVYTFLKPKIVLESNLFEMKMA